MTEAQAETAAPEGVEALTAEIEHTREALGETVQALADKADVKAHVQEKVTEHKVAVAAQATEIKDHAVGLAESGREAATHAVTQVRRRLNARVAGATVGGAAAVGLLVWWRRRR